jgi:hypothetical protein
VAGKQASTSFSVEKEAKRLSTVYSVGTTAAKRMKVFWFFFSKKNTLSSR